MNPLRLPLLAALASTLMWGGVASAADRPSLTEKVSLTVKVGGAKASVGQAICSLFDSAESYLEEPVSSVTLPVDAAGGAVFVFPGLAPGVYAVSVVYDEDTNGELNTGLLGIPIELVAMSNNAKGRFGPPSFAKAGFDLAADQTIEVVFVKAK